MKNNSYSKETKIQASIMRNSGYSLAHIRKILNIKSDSQITVNRKRIQKKLNGLSPIEYRTKTA